MENSLVVGQELVETQSSSFADLAHIPNQMNGFLWCVCASQTIVDIKSVKDKVACFWKPLFMYLG
jgi:hypothetical protein